MKGLMSTRDIISFDIEKNGRTYTFLIPHGSPYDEAYVVANEIMLTIHEMKKAAVEAAKANSAPIDVVPEVVDLT